MSRSLRWFAIATWGASAFLVATFAAFWRMGYVPPHAAWAVVTTGAVVVATILTVIAGLLQLIRAPCRALTAATVLLGTTPVICMGMFLLTLMMQNSHREPITMNVATRIVGFWAISAADVE